MSRIRPLATDEVPEQARAWLTEGEAALGARLLPARIEAHCPPIMEASQILAAAPGQSGTLPRRLRSLMSLRVAQLVGSPFCMDAGAAVSRRAGVSNEELTALSTFRESSLFRGEERAALALAEAMTTTPATVPDDVFDALRAWFSEPQLVELAATAAMENYRARFNRAFAIEAQGLYSQAPRQAEPVADGPDMVIEASMESFPASDAPAWTTLSVGWLAETTD